MQVSVVYKIALCLEELGDWEGAVKELQAIPRANRNATINSFLGRMYQRLGRRNRAIDAYKVRFCWCESCAGGRTLQCTRIRC
jgi:tetratricopeptide (TPR) repeat protein